MKKGDRYDVSGLEEAKFEPKSHRRVLKNLLGIKSKREMDRVEQHEQIRALEDLLWRYGPDQRFTADDICLIHKIWLGPIYSWAGEYRNVNISKGNFPFATAQHIPKLMGEFEKGPLRDFTPCSQGEDDDFAYALSVVHVELVLLHPFRDGNGRTARILANLMAAQGGLPLLDFSGITGKKRERYFAAIRAGLGKNYEPMTRVFINVVNQTLEISGGL